MLLEVKPLARLPGMILADIHYRQRSPALSPAEPESAHGICLVRSGWFRRESAGQHEFVDATGGFVARKGVLERVAGPDARFTWIELTPEAYDTHLEGSGYSRDWLLRTGADLHSQHWGLFAAARRGIDHFELTERTLILIEALPRRPEWRGLRVRPQTSAAHRRLAAAAQEALNCRLLLGLDELAALVNTSPHHLSRVFRAVTGRTITSYRNELRVRSILDHLAGGATNLADLAAAHGFVDHAHMTRVVRRHAGQTPSLLRRDLSTKVQALGKPAGAA